MIADISIGANLSSQIVGSSGSKKKKKRRQFVARRNLCEPVSCEIMTNQINSMLALHIWTQVISAHQSKWEANKSAIAGADQSGAAQFARVRSCTFAMIWPN